MKMQSSATFTWRCPYCGHHAVIDRYKFSAFSHHISMGNIHGPRMLFGNVTVCPNRECREFTLSISISEITKNDEDETEFIEKHKWDLIPESKAKVFPSYIPAPLISDYREACLIADKSPKASATLSRRCLQGMIRDFWQVKKGRLVDEIEAIKEKVDPDTWDAIDSLRKVGNIGAHMEKDISLIIDVDPGEADLLIELIETLFEEWYIRRHTRKERMAHIKRVATQKDTAKTVQTSNASASGAIKPAPQNTKGAGQSARMNRSAETA